MFPKINLSRFSSLAALGIFAAVLGGCAESTAGTSPNVPQTARLEVIRTPFENPLPRITSTTAPTDVISTHKLAAHRATRFADVH